MTETRKLAAILAADVVGYSRLAGADEERTLARLRGLRSDLSIPPLPPITGASSSAPATARCRVPQRGRRGALPRRGAERHDQRNAGVPDDRRIEFRIGVHLGDVVEEADGDLMGDGVNIAARLEGIAAPGGVCLSEDAFRQVKGRLDLAATDLGEKELKNIVEPVRVHSLQIGLRAQPKPAVPEPARLALPDRPSIAVLPFQNMSDDPSQEYFADGMVEDIITGLSRIKWLFVIARNSSFVYKGKAVDVRQVGRELGVRYVLEGGVRKAGSRLRITGQLVEAETGAHLWADKFDGALDDVFELQDRITESVVGVVEPSVRRSEIERSRRKHPENLEAYDLYLRALPHTAPLMPADARIAVGFLQKALELDPNLASAHAYLAWSHEICFMRGGFGKSDRSAGLHHARAATASRTDDATALAVAGFVINNLSGDRKAALSAIERALSLNASCATALYLSALLYSIDRNFAVATPRAERALRLSPFDPLASQAHVAFGHERFAEARYGDAARHYAEAAQANPRFSWLYFFQAIAMALAGQVAEAGPVAQRGLELEPGFRIRAIPVLGTASEMLDKFIEGGRLLGLPE